MKFNNNSIKFKIFIFLICISIILSNDTFKTSSLNSLKTNQEDEKKGNQLKAFPALTTPFTMKEYFKDNDLRKTKVPFSRALAEFDFSQKIKRRQFVERINYTLYNLSRGEINFLFDFIDINKDDLVSGQEWDAFMTLFVYPFEACNTKNNYYLDESEWKTCWENDPNSNNIKFEPNKEGATPDKQILKTFAFDDNGFNLTSYVVMRRIIYSWIHCVSSKLFINKKDFKCAFKLAIPTRFNIKVEYDKVYSAVKMFKNVQNTDQMEFFEFLNLMNDTLVFFIFAYPSNIPYIHKTNFIKAVHEGRWPNNFTEEEINIFFESTSNNPTLRTNLLNLESFIFFYHYHRIFISYSKKKIGFLSKEEFQQIFKDNILPKLILDLVNGGISNIEEKDYLEASIVLQKFRLNELDFYSFIEKSNTVSNKNFANFALKTNSKQENEVKYNQKNIDNFISILYGVEKGFVSQRLFFLGFQICNLYVYFTDIIKKPYVSNIAIIENIQKAYDTVNPSFSLAQRENYKYYKLIPREVSFDILGFLTLEVNKMKFDQIKSSRERLVDETIIKSVLKDYGMQNMPDTVVDLAKKGYDKLQRRLYDPNELIKFCILVHAVAVENSRSKELIKQLGLNQDEDITKKYKNFLRRQVVSPLV